MEASDAAIQRASLKLKEMALGAMGSDEKVLRLIPSAETGSVQASHISITESVNGWVVEKHPAKKTIYEWTRVLRESEVYLGYDNARLITSADLNNWKAKLLVEGRKPKTIRDAMVAPVRAILQWGADNDRLQENPAGPIFGKLSPDKFGSRDGHGTKMLGRWVRALGIEDLRISPNHSWRHRLKTLARKRGMSGDLVDAIVGHRQRTGPALSARGR